MLYIIKKKKIISLLTKYHLSIVSLLSFHKSEFLQITCHLQIIRLLAKLFIFLYVIRLFANCLSFHKPYQHYVLFKQISFVISMIDNYNCVQVNNDIIFHF